MRCAVSGCTNFRKKSNKYWTPGVSFFRFPKDPQILKGWIHFCKRTNQINLNTERICSDHFHADDYQRDMKFELGLRTRKLRILEPGSVPIYTRHVHTDRKHGISELPIAKEKELLEDSELNSSSPSRKIVKINSQTKMLDGIISHGEKQTLYEKSSPFDKKTTCSSDSMKQERSFITNTNLNRDKDTKLVSSLRGLEEEINVSPKNSDASNNKVETNKAKEGSLRGLEEHLSAKKTANSSTQLDGKIINSFTLDKGTEIWEIEALDEEESALYESHAIVSADTDVNIQSQDYEMLWEQKEECISEMRKMQGEIFSRKKIEEMLQAKQESLDHRLAKNKFITTNLENMLASIFTCGQTRKLTKGSKLMKWSRKDIIGSIKIPSIGAATDQYLKSEDYESLREQKEECISEMKKMKEEILRLGKKEESLKTKIESLRKQLAKSKSITKNLENVLVSIFTSGRIRNLKNFNSKEMNWSQKDFYNFIKLYSVSPDAYLYLKCKNFPLPTVLTVKRWSQKVQELPIDVSSGWN